MKHYILLILLLGFNYELVNDEQVDDVHVIDDFESAEIDLYPDGWKGRKDEAKEEYIVKHHKDNKYLEAKSRQSDMFIIKECDIDAADYNYINWKWRVHDTPEKGNESVKEFCDAPAAIAVIFRLSKWRPKSLKYTFSSTLPPFEITKSPYSRWPARTDIMVLRSQTSDGLGNWFSEKRNILEDYKKIYGCDDVDELKIEGIMIMTDSDNTGTSAHADYDDIFFSRE